MCLFFLFGIVPREKQIGTETCYCPFDEHETTCTLYERRTWFMLFFVPVFPVSGKQVVKRCNTCGMDISQAGFYRQAFPQSQRTKICPSCGSEVSGDANYCPSCGYQFN